MSDQNTGFGKWISGILATIIAGVIVFYLTEERRGDPPNPPSRVEFSVLNQLGPMQISEEVKVYIKDKLVANLTVNQQKTTDSARVEVSHVGSYSYTILADGIFQDQFGQSYRTQGQGDGVIEVSKGKVFELTITPYGLRLTPR
jgi:hypothetical protein